LRDRVRLFLLLFVWIDCYAFDQVVHMNNRGTGTYYITSVIDSHEVSLLLDTGASYTVLDKSIVSRMNLNQVSKMDALTADGRRIHVTVHVLPSMTIEGCTIYDTEVVTMSNTINILGMTSIKKMTPLTLLGHDDVKFNCH
jgi:predicted aspartyl protease